MFPSIQRSGWDGSAVCIRPSLGVEGPYYAFAGALTAVALTYCLAANCRFAAVSSLFATCGVAVASFLTAIQTFVLQQNVDTIRQVYSWILGRLTVASWDEVSLPAPYSFIASTVILAPATTNLGRDAVGRYRSIVVRDPSSNSAACQ